MTPQAFIAHWQDKDITERAGAQQHFNDLCDLLGVEKPRDPESYCFERGAKIQSGQGWADVWKRGCFAWEYKGPGKDLKAALKQLMNYALALDNPPLLVVSDLSTIEIHTHFTGHPSETHLIRLQDLTQPETRQKLLWLFTEPERFKPVRTSYAVTEEAAKRMGEIATRLTERGNAPHDVAHFLIQCVFCMFAEDARILPEKLFETVMDKSNPDGTKAQKRLADLFAAMQTGGEFALNDIPWFNGGLFETIAVPQLETSDVVALLDAARMDWSAIEPAILGTLFERGLNPDMRSQLGAHYTDPATIMKLIKPVVEAPLLAEWETAKAVIVAAKKDKDKQAAFIGFLERLKNFRVLDPACGSGNFLYLALKTLKDIEHRANLEAEALGLHRQMNVEVSPANVMGIELNPYAAELARVSVWIGEIQWMLAHGYAYRKDPILQKLDHIECRDAILNVDNSEAAWPEVDAIVSNPPFLGDRKMIRELGENYTNILRACYQGRVPGGADLVTYWFEKARAQIEQGKSQYAGLVATNSIRGGANRKVLERIVESGSIFEAWSDEEWINEGAAVRVSLLCFGGNADAALLDGQPVATIHADLTAGGGLDLTQAKVLAENGGFAFIGTQKNGPFDIPGDVARQWLRLPNPNGRPNSNVVRPWANGMDITRCPSDTWVIDFNKMSESEAALYEVPFQHVMEHVKPTRIHLRRDWHRIRWWLHGDPRPAMKLAIAGLARFIITPRVSKYRLFTWMPVMVLPDSATVAIACSDDTTFGILHSRFHELWSLRMGTSLEDRPRYTPSTTFETFPFPVGLTPRDHGENPAIAAAAQHLDQLRTNWLNPPEWVDWVRTPQEEQAGYPARPVAKPGHEADLKKRTLTNLYNARPAWLDNAHKQLDAAVAAAYGWADYTPEMPDEEILRRLLKLNLERSA
jgi:type II restriction/modification system DNA methylase subunit YeeA